MENNRVKCSVFTAASQRHYLEKLHINVNIYIYMNEHVKAVVLHLTSLTAVVYC